MNEKILKEVLAWYDNHENCTNVNIKEFVDLIIDKAADAIFDEVKTQLKGEFEEGTLTHPFIISPDYYLDLKLKEIRDRCVKPKNIEDTQDGESGPAEI
ncbi:MAG: hypothetical protein JW771_07895 [Candidatus Thermoplasmatota archaeon]|nr:hypothetical protein [Candidatus Thermoplasmatota archaeon]